MVEQAAAAFFGMVGLDYVCAKYTKAVADNKRMVASVLASIMLLFSATIVLTYVHDPLMLLPAAFGAFVGTYLAGS